MILVDMCDGKAQISSLVFTGERNHWPTFWSTKKEARYCAFAHDVTQALITKALMLQTTNSIT